MRNRVYRFIIAILLGLAVFFGILAYREHKPFMDAKVSHEAIKKAVVSQKPEENSDSPMDRKIDFTLLKEIKSWS